MAKGGSRRGGQRPRPSIPRGNDGAGISHLVPAAQSAPVNIGGLRAGQTQQPLPPLVHPLPLPDRHKQEIASFFIQYFQVIKVLVSIEVDAGEVRPPRDSHSGGGGFGSK